MPSFIHQGYFADFIHDQIANAPLADRAYDALDSMSVVSSIVLYDKT